MTHSDEKIKKVWNKAKVVGNNDPDVYRKDQCDAWIRRESYGNTNSPYGWEVDHINPDGGDELANLRPLHWKNNRAKGEGPLKCVVTSKEGKNVDIE